MSKLTFDVLRLANTERLPTFKNSRGELTHNATGSDWSPLEWGAAMNGEVGELIEVVLEFARRALKIGDTLKKVRRGDLDPTLATVREAIAKELADVQIYLDLLASRFAIDLGEATLRKFNEVSKRVGSPVFIEAHPTSGQLCVRLPPCDFNVTVDSRPTDSGEFPNAPGDYAAERAAAAQGMRDYMAGGRGE